MNADKWEQQLTEKKSKLKSCLNHIISILDYTAVGFPVYSSRLMKALFSWDKVFIELPAQANVQLETIKNRRFHT